jgi:hypothetical protein
MAEGVGNAAVIIPFMTEQYEASTNCKLELKFSQQTGVPIVPVLMQKDYNPRGWLGLLTGATIVRCRVHSSVAIEMYSLHEQGC